MSHILSPKELARRIEVCSARHDKAATALLSIYVPAALDLMKNAEDRSTMLELATAVVGVKCRRLLPVPEWVAGYLYDAVSQARNNPLFDRRDLVLPLLTLNLNSPHSSLEREAMSIVNGAYRSIGKPVPGNDPGQINDAVTDLYTAVTFSDYVARFSVRKVGKRWAELTSSLTSMNTDPSLSGVSRLLSVADRISPFITLPSSLRQSLINASAPASLQ